MRILYNIHCVHAREKSVKTKLHKKKGPAKAGPKSKIGKFTYSDDKETAEAGAILIAQAW